MRKVIFLFSALLFVLVGCGSIDSAQHDSPMPGATAEAAATIVVEASPRKETRMTDTPSVTPEDEQPDAPVPTPSVPPMPIATSVPVMPTVTPTHTPFLRRATQLPVQVASPTPVTPTDSQVESSLDPQLDAVVQGARADLAQRQGVAVDTVEVVEVRSVTWPDSALGCPQPGMAYKQVTVDGLLIQLRVRGQVFNYHSGGRKAPFLCQQPQKLVATPGSGGGDQGT